MLLVCIAFCYVASSCCSFVSAIGEGLALHAGDLVLLHPDLAFRATSMHPTRINEASLIVSVSHERLVHGASSSFCKGAVSEHIRFSDAVARFLYFYLIA